MGPTGKRACKSYTVETESGPVTVVDTPPGLRDRAARLLKRRPVRFFLLYVALPLAVTLAGSAIWAWVSGR